MALFARLMGWTSTATASVQGDEGLPAVEWAANTILAQQHGLIQIHSNRLQAAAAVGALTKLCLQASLADQAQMWGYIEAIASQAVDLDSFSDDIPDDSIGRLGDSDWQALGLEAFGEYGAELLSKRDGSVTVTTSVPGTGGPVAAGRAAAALLWSVLAIPDGDARKSALLGLQWASFVVGTSVPMRAQAQFTALVAQRALHWETLEWPGD